MDTITPKHKLYIEAENIIKKSENCSTSYIQRKLEIGYNRAHTIMELLEENNVVTAPDKNAIRKLKGNTSE
ncbi:MAG: DNA translocase FtsK [Campylobacterota bacterium]|nr:DNA translocase FtsK [Campylobacterota bacterium]